MQRYICIHGHFYQPPREDPWLGVVEEQESAHPYHDWNERITAECYAPNASSPILDGNDRIVRTINNYAKISFNFGPTLLSWMDRHKPDVYRAILEADRLSQQRFSGHGSAIAQVYNHMIMPLAGKRDKQTQVIWGIKDFQKRFERFPEGMWLPETAVDLETLETLAESNIKFTILAPHQVRTVKEIERGEWQDMSGGRIDPTMAYLCYLPSGRSIAIFVYDGPISRDVAFGELLNNGALFAERLLGAFSSQRDWPQMVHTATDGETYGHYRRFANMALAYGLSLIESDDSVTLTNYGEYLEKNPPTRAVQIVENSSWSCAHGIERWRDNCGCHSGMHSGWTQSWRKPLREAMDWLENRIATIYDEEAATYLRDPREARDAYIEVLLDRSMKHAERFLQAHARRKLTRREIRKVLKLLEMQKYAMLTYTSCGWFFDDISGIEAVQVMRYGARAMELAEEVRGIKLEPEYVRMLEKAPSNLHENGAKVYDRSVRQVRIQLSRVEGFRNILSRSKKLSQSHGKEAMQQRGSGILLHITSLPSHYGIGDLGPSAHRFADFLAEARQCYWQILPLNPTGTAYGNSPYSSYSAFAGNPLLISPDLLAQDGLLDHDELEEPPLFPEKGVDYEAVTQYKARLLDRAYQRYRSRLSGDREFKSFCRDNAEWLEDYSLFMTLRACFREIVWSEWPGELRDRKEEAIDRWKIQCPEQIEKEQFFQYLFYKQWAALKRYCSSKNISIVGDLPIYVNYDSADVWAHPEIFKLDDERRPTVVAGVPPDYFSATGQLWGNPVYRWDALKATEYAWWIRRVSHNVRCFDKVRLDHFRGFVACWEISAAETTAIHGQWVKAPADDFFTALVKYFPDLPIFAEDLGVITADVREIMERFRFPGMKVLLFAFGNDLPANPFTPHNYGRNFVVYTGTHDTNTARGWFNNEANSGERERLSAYIGREVSEEQVPWELIRLASISVADTAIVPMQDLLGLGEEARMNRPATTKGNWEWRLMPEQITPSLAAQLAELTRLYGRARALN